MNTTITGTTATPVTTTPAHQPPAKTVGGRGDLGGGLDAMVGRLPNGGAITGPIAEQYRVPHPDSDRGLDDRLLAREIAHAVDVKA